MVGTCLSQKTQKAILRCLAEQVISAEGLSENEGNLAADPRRLYYHVLKAPIDWQRIAAEVGEDRNRIYHWYRETHSRNVLNVKMTAEDRDVIRSIILQGIEDRSILTSNFYNRIQERFGEKYPRQELRMTYNNALRTRAIRTAMEEYKLSMPSKKHPLPSCIKHIDGDFFNRMLALGVRIQPPQPSQSPSPSSIQQPSASPTTSSQLGDASVPLLTQTMDLGLQSVVGPQQQLAPTPIPMQQVDAGTHGLFLKSGPTQLLGQDFPNYAIPSSNFVHTHAHNLSAIWPKLAPMQLAQPLQAPHIPLTYLPLIFTNPGMSDTLLNSAAK